MSCPTGGGVRPGHFDSIASTGFDSHLYGSLVPASVPDPASVILLAAGVATVAWRHRGRFRRA